jgi:hypothetical protein
MPLLQLNKRAAAAVLDTCCNIHSNGCDYLTLLNDSAHLLLPEGAECREGLAVTVHSL